MRNPFKKKKAVNTTPYTWDTPYKETRTVKTVHLNEDDDGDGWAHLRFDCKEDWTVCLNQYKRLGSPAPEIK